jgi:LysM repeat protein
MNRSTVLLLGLLAVLGAIVYFVLPGDEEQIVSYDKTPVAFSVDSASVVKLSIERPGRRLVIENVGGRWTITSHGNLIADPARVMEVVGGLSRFKSGSLVSSNPAKQPVFQVDSSGSLVTLTERSGAKRSIIIGKMGPSFSEVYFRMPGASNVYLGNGVTTWSLEREVKDWRDRTIFAAPAEAVTGLSISSGGRSRDFRKDSAGWKSGPEEVPTETINPVLTALAELRAEDFIDSELQFSGAPSTVEVTGGVGAKLEFYRLANDTGRYAVATSTSGQKYIVGRYTAIQLFRPVGDPRSSGVAALRKGAPGAVPSRGVETAGAGEARTEPAAIPKESAKARPVPSAPVTPLETARETPKETPKETARPPASKPPATGTVNPFKQKPSGERASQPPAVAPTPPSSGQTGKTTPPSDTRQTQQQQTKPPAQTPAQPPVKTPAQAVQKPPASTPGKVQPPAGGGAGGEDEGELTVHVVKKGESMTTIAGQYGVSVEQILKWNLLKSISVKPGQELYIFTRK